MIAIAMAMAAVVAAALWWAWASPARIAAAGAPIVAAHPDLTVGLTLAVTVVFFAVAAAIVYRSLKGCGWRLICETPAPAGAT